MQCLTIRADVTNEKAVIDAINATVEKFGRIDYAACVMLIVILSALTAA